MAGKPVDNLFGSLPSRRDREHFQTLLKRRGVRLERIVSFGQRTPDGQWLKEKQGEWVVLLRGSATLAFKRGADVKLKPGDYLFIPANTAHRVERTHLKKTTVWLALHAGPGI